MAQEASPGQMLHSGGHNREGDSNSETVRMVATGVVPSRDDACSDDYYLRTEVFIISAKNLFLVFN